MEYSLMLKVCQAEILFRLFEVLHYHLMIIFGYGIMDWHVAIIVFGIKFWPYILHNTRFTFQADDMLDGLALVILLASRQEEIVCACKPVKHLNITFAGADEEHVFTLVVLHRHCS